MSASLKRIGLILLVVILLPTLFYSVYEISYLNQNEETIAKIYERQLDAFLFSINQYADDAVSSWSGKMISVFQEGEDPQEGLAPFLSKNAAISHIFLADSAGKDVIAFSRDSLGRDVAAERFSKMIWRYHEESIEPLFRYLRVDYRKTEAFTDELFPGQVVMVFVWQDPEEQLRICGFAIDPIKFINRSLSARMQTISDESFIIAAVRRTGDTLIYATDTLSNQVLEKRAPLWLLPDYELGITSQGTSIEELVRTRTYINLGMILVLDIVLLLGIWWVFRNIRREISLAQLKSDFVSNVSHEIRTPLSLISMFAETLRLDRVPSEEKRKQYYDILHQEATRLTGLVNRILNFSQIESGNRIYKHAPTDLNVIVEHVLPSYEFHLRQKGFEVVFLPDEELPMIQADMEALSEALINLLDNAVKYSPDEKKIEIITGRTGGHVFLAVSDKGIGIPEDKREMIFDKFYRVSEGNSVHNTQGAGLGLSLVRQIVAAHDGHITLTSSPGKGSRFQLNFPLTPH